ncbi:Organic solute transporter Ost-alpha [Corchorus olitorius]|uniref:Organic solute transporter Ost-alpha n=1 Tax=Corchorus olitorius TaxID=93759 RepID=A0A1R3H409_9ROSI|nr:Organic solute transporter Ost-alpha [Corchorus olitorius]
MTLFQPRTVRLNHQTLKLLKYWTWQFVVIRPGIVLDILVSMGIIKSHHFWMDAEHLEEAYQNILVCLEMVVFSVLQQYAYNVSPYSGETEAKMRLGKKNE